MTRISAGSFDLNKWMQGGYEKDIVTVLYGGPGSGKTNFCLLAAVSQAKKGEKVIFIDSEGGFSVERIKQLIDDTNSGGEDLDKILKNIFLLKPTSFNEQKEAFGQILKYLNEGVSLIVVDSMTILYRLDFADAREKDAKAEGGGMGEIQKINADLARQMKMLSEIALKREIPVIVTNQIYHWEDSVKMVGGDVMQYWAKCIIELSNDKGRREAKLIKHRNLAEKSLFFQIWDGGIRKRGWL